MRVDNISIWPLATVPSNCFVRLNDLNWTRGDGGYFFGTPRVLLYNAIMVQVSKNRACW